MGLRMIFTNSKKIGSLAIRWVTWSDYSHCTVLVDDETIVHSDFHGVRVEPLQALKDRSKHWMIVEFKCEDPQAIINACLAQVGKPYDYTGLVGILVRDVDLQDDSKWWCSEVPAHGGEVTNQPFFQTEFMHRITPQHWLMLPHTVIEKG